ncbi:MBL fold metallo-hydrolase [Peribacillus saganii]|uniref:MBL fold metallo-hydrolase n=1 Tax=Peribacillus saganii TaxID=2303992 RepID=A0A372LJY1_9BACI|nr:MBL fold metallo-hydrolase [Peribacillus saganii]RFU66324.1 MBL fold metallo-hydrolase [Peribacillus saganii]
MKRKRFENYDNVRNTNSFCEMLKWSKERRSKKKDLTVNTPNWESPEIERLKHNHKDFSVTWIGHSTFLIQIDGLNILTDPVWAKRMGFQKRLTEPGIPLTDMPEIDIVVISHGHYDHLDFGSIRRLKGAPVFYVPVGLKGAFRRRGYKKLVEANWWDSFTHDGIRLSFVPAQHWTRRTITDMNTSHWGGWVVEGTAADPSVYFVGDTGYFRGFRDIASQFNLDIVLMPIGAYEPEWFMAVSHINPEDSIKAFLELKGKTFIPMHYGAYRLADDTGPEALSRLLKEWKRLQLSDDSLRVLGIGETLWDYRKN